jgi:hypothetical protein
MIPAPPFFFWSVARAQHIRRNFGTPYLLPFFPNGQHRRPAFRSAFRQSRRAAMTTYTVKMRRLVWQDAIGILLTGSDSAKWKGRMRAHVEPLVSSERTPTSRPHDDGNRRQPFLIFQILQGHGKAAAPIRMLISRPRQIDLIHQFEDVLH